jgi:hypothetical protein
MASYMAKIFGAILRANRPCAISAEMSAAKPRYGEQNCECHYVWRIAPRSRRDAAYMLTDHGRGQLYAPVNLPLALAVNGLEPILAAA